MYELFLDANFYVAVSFILFVSGLVAKTRDKVANSITKRIELISCSLNSAVCEKDQALLAFTKANNAMAKLPDDIAKIWATESVDFASANIEMQQVLATLEAVNNARLARLQSVALQAEYFNVVENIANKFRLDVQLCDEQKRDLLVKQALTLLNGVRID
jgi:hypothetical protein